VRRIAAETAQMMQDAEKAVTSLVNQAGRLEMLISELTSSPA
jgi:hypothetical protein